MESARLAVAALVAGVTLLAPAPVCAQPPALDEVDRDGDGKAEIDGGVPETQKRGQTQDAGADAGADAGVEQTGASDAQVEVQADTQVDAQADTEEEAPRDADTSDADPSKTDTDTKREQRDLPVLPEPDDRPAVWAGEVHFGLVFPFADTGLCPAGGEGLACIFGEGGGIGGSAERRWPSGYSLGIGYDAWFLDGNGVFEVSVVQMLSAIVRYQFLRESRIHPFVGGGGGVLLFGDSFRVSAVGGALRAEIGVEIELTETIALTMSPVWWVFITSSFETNDGRANRGGLDGLNAAAAVNVGLVIVEQP